MVDLMIAVQVDALTDDVALESSHATQHLDLDNRVTLRRLVPKALEADLLAIWDLHTPIPTMADSMVLQSHLHPVRDKRMDLQGEAVETSLLLAARAARNLLRRP